MSGIAGLWNLDGRPVDPRSVERMAEAMVHRGPDRVGYRIDGSMGLAHCMLQTTTESKRERLPLSSENADVWLTLDGRVDNRADLKARLRDHGIRLRDDTDAELVLKAYECWGTESSKHIVGDFAYVIWNKRTRTLFCARDCVGVRPFVYYLSDDLFVFASEINALLRVPEVPCEVNELRIAEFLVSELEGSDKTITFYQDIHRLPPASVLIVSPAKSELKPYWTLDPGKEVKYRSDAEYVEAFQEVFTEAVRCRLRTDGPVASMLSGGMDSSAIVGIGRKLLTDEGDRRRLVTISAVSEQEDNCVEAPYINAILAQGGLESHKIYVSDTPVFASDFERLVKQTDDPFILYSANIPWLASCVTRRNGIRVLFSGLDGDLVTSSNDFWLIQLLRAGRLWSFCKEARARVSYLRPYYESRANPRAQAAWDYGIRPLISAFMLSPHTKLYRRLTRANDRQWAGLLKESPINRSFAKRLNVNTRLELQNQLGSLGALSARDIQCSSLQAPFLVAALERYDRVAASQSVELRHPLLDRRLVEFCAALPSEQKWAQGWRKLIMRRALVGILPNQVCWRGYSSTNLMALFGYALFAGLRNCLSQLAAQGWRSIARYVNLTQLEQALERYRQDPMTEKQWVLWQAVFLTSWLHNNNRRIVLSSNIATVTN